MKKTATAFLAVMALLLALATAACSNSSSGGGSGPTYGGGSAGDGNVTATEAELAVITEMNYARTKPQEYVSQRLQPLVSSSSGTYLTALNECISQMNAMSPLRELAFGQGLYKAAQEWVAEQGKGSSTGHASNWDARISKYCTYSTVGENIAYGYYSAQDIVVALLVDDGVADRGHRRNILEMGGYGPYTHAGPAIGSHAGYGTMCCIEYAGGYSDSN